MSKQLHAIGNDLGQLAEDARTLRGATADASAERVGEARKRFAAKSGQETKHWSLITDH